MCRKDTPSGWECPGKLARGVLAVLLGAASVWAQTPAGIRPDWRHIGNSAVDLALASAASGPVERVWYSADGNRLFVQTQAGDVFETSDFERWQSSSAVPPPAAPNALAASVPAGTLGVRAAPADERRLYAFGDQVYRSDDGGVSWTGLTAFHGQSIIGGGMRDLAVSPRDIDQLSVANSDGVWRSLDGGASWTGLNETLPNLPALKILSVPHETAGFRLLTGALGAIEWAPGERATWRTIDDPAVAQDAASRAQLSRILGVQITALAAAGDFVYAGSADGRIWVSADRGRNWNPPPPADRGPVEAIFVDVREPRQALAALGTNPRGVTGQHVLRTINAGLFWDDLTADLPETPVSGITADRPTGTVYAATGRGVYMARADLNAAGPANPWTQLAGLPEAPALDVRLDSGGDQLYVALQGYGVYGALAPHRLGSLRLVNAADFSQRAAAPGSLLSVLGVRVRTARAGEMDLPVLASSDTETQIQVPFSARGSSLAMALETSAGTFRLVVPVESVSPAIFVDRDGTPLVLNADTGVLLDAMNTAHSNSRLQILATGLGAVRPDWPAGMAGPFDNPPQVVALVQAYLDRTPVEVTRAVLAPGYIGLYLVEVQLPALVNAGPAELYISSGDQQSNRVRVWIEP
jgi:uncharacterized protein (TIGR03437 family)